MAGYMICVCASSVTNPGGNPVGIVALNGKNGDIPLEGVGPAPYFYDHHSIAQEAAGFADVNRPYTNAEWESRKTDQWDIDDSRNRALLGGAYVASNSPIDFQAFKNGIYQITGITVTRTGNSGEGAAIYVDLQTLSIPTGITIYWTLTGQTGAAQNGFTPSSGGTAVTSTAPGNWPGTAARITLTPDLDNITEGAGSFVIQIRQGGTGGTIFYNSAPISVGDTSLYPYFGTTPASINEGASDTFNVSGYDITGPRSPATYYWSVDNASRFGTSSGSFVIANNVGSFSVSPLINLQTDGATTVTVSLRLTSAAGPVIATRTFVINDLSLTPAFTSQPTSINEGSAGTFSVSGFTAGANQTFYWSLTYGTASNADFGTPNGSFTINNGGSFTVTPTADSISEGNPTLSPYFSSAPRIVGGTETFFVQLRRGSVSGTVVATSAAVTINDTSLNPLVALNYTYNTDRSNVSLTVCQMSSAGADSFSGGPYQLCRANTINITIGASARIYSVNGNPAFWLGGGRTDDIVNLIVNGSIRGLGGNGTCMYNGPTSSNPGGTAVKLGLQSVVLSGSGAIVGGGGGGGSFNSTNTSPTRPSLMPTPGGGGAGGGAGGGNSGAGSTFAQGSPTVDNGFCTFYTTGGTINATTYRAGGGGGLIGSVADGRGLHQSNGSTFAQRGIGGGQGGGGGASRSSAGLTIALGSGVRGGNGGRNGCVGGSGVVPGQSGLVWYAAGGGGGGWGAAGGPGASQGSAGSSAVAGGAGGKAICLNGRGVSGSVSTRYGAIS